jgi:hypothetical protein
MIFTPSASSIEPQPAAPAPSSARRDSWSETWHLFESVPLKECSCVLGQHGQVERIRWRLFEAALHVPRLRAVVLGMAKEGTGADRLRRFGAAKQSVLIARGL